MKLEQYKKDAHEFQGLASGLVRQLALAGIALIWIFKIDKPIEHLLPNECYWPLLIFVLTLGFDFLQYFIPSIIWMFFFRYHEKKNNGNVEIELKAKKIYSVPGYFFYIGKVILLFIGYILIIKYLLCKL
jgi:hypothetical protein